MDALITALVSAFLTASGMAAVSWARGMIELRFGVSLNERPKALPPSPKSGAPIMVPTRED